MTAASALAAAQPTPTVAGPRIAEQSSPGSHPKALSWPGQATERERATPPGRAALPPGAVTAPDNAQALNELAWVLTTTRAQHRSAQATNQPWDPTNYHHYTRGNHSHGHGKLDEARGLRASLAASPGKPAQAKTLHRNTPGA